MTVRQLSDRIEARELDEWKAYFRISPFGEDRADWRLALLSSMFANVHRGKGAPTFKPRDFVWKRPGPPKRMDWRAMRDVFAGIAARANAGKPKRGGQ